jgi:hypothetical protein
MAENTTSRPRQLSDGREEGTILGQSSADKVSFFAATPVVQKAHIADAATSTITTAVTTTTGNCWGFATSTQGADVLAILADLRTKHNTLQVLLADYGLTASS